MNQAQFRNALLDPDLAAPEGMTDPHGRPPGKRFAVYRNNVAVGLTTALETGFPVLRRLLGPDFFTAMAGVFLRAHPPRSRLMMLYGAEMPDFILSFPPVAHLPYLPDVARLEFALRQSYHAKDTAAIDPAVLGELSGQRFLAARLCIAPSVGVVRSAWPIHAVWRANTSDTNQKLVWEPETVLIVRRDFDPTPHVVAAEAGVFIERLIAGDPVADALAIAGEALDLTACLSVLLHGGAVIGVIED